MKISKSLFLAFAGLGLFACSNEDVTEGGVQGNSSVTVKVNLPQLLTESRSGEGIAAGKETAGTTGDQTPVVIGEKGVTVTLYAASGTTEETLSMDGSSTLTGSFTFQNVRTPQRVEVSVNGGTVTDLSIDQINEAGLAAPLYATSSDFQAGEDGKSYTISVTPQPRYARLELSGITHDTDHGTGSCIFKKAKLAGLFLDNVWVTEKSAAGMVNVANNAGIWDNIKKADYASPTWSAIDADFFAASATWPVAGNCYAYSLFGETQLPSVVFVLDGTTLQFNDGVQMAGYTSGADLYARVSTFKINKPADWDQKKEEYKTKYGVDDNGQFISFKAGNIYQISDIAIPDKAWGTTPGGGTDVSVTATVNVLPWTVVEGTVEW
ncbi:hypothetical protein [Phocaeicola coprophilus]|uniref:hypothetical protein n=1 Tax=Phocaeicola coprophilus TaxID=387090 RepID=UPI00255CF29E|nr:hypothetical protein [Phocaeicola coprophilus]